VIVSGFSGERPEAGDWSVPRPPGPPTQNVFKDTNGVKSTDALAFAALPTPLRPSALTLSVNGAWFAPTSPDSLAVMVHPALIFPLASVVQVPVSVPEVQLRFTVEFAFQLPPVTVIEVESEALVNAYEFGLTPMNGVGVIVALSIVSDPP
jgi:hypothetical protein